MLKIYYTAMNMEAPRKSNRMWERLMMWLLPIKDPSTDYRFEKKFLVPLTELSAFEMQLARHACSPIHKPRWINNLYGDTHDLNHFHENIEGLSERKKLRFRWYGKPNGEINVTAEYKIKVDDTNTKKSVQLGPINFPKETPLNTLFELCLQKWETLQDSDIQAPFGYQAALLNRYKRCYFLSADERIRITIDTPIHFHNAFNGIKATQNQYAVVELKCPKNHIIYTDLLPYQLSKSSKYVEGLQLTDPLFEPSSL